MVIKMNYTLIFTQEQLLVLNQALQDLPFKIVAPLFDAINMQIKEQEQIEADKADRNK